MSDLIGSSDMNGVLVSYEQEDAEMNSDLWTNMSVLMIVVVALFIIVFVIERMEDKKIDLMHSQNNKVNFYLAPSEISDQPVIVYKGDEYDLKSGLFKFMRIARQIKGKIYFNLQGDSLPNLGSYFYVRDTILKNFPPKRINWKSSLHTGLDPEKKGVKDGE